MCLVVIILRIATFMLLKFVRTEFEAESDDQFAKHYRDLINLYIFYVSASNAHSCKVKCLSMERKGKKMDSFIRKWMKWKVIRFVLIISLLFLLFDTILILGINLFDTICNPNHIKSDKKLLVRWTDIPLVALVDWIF